MTSRTFGVVLASGLVAIAAGCSGGTTVDGVDAGHDAGHVGEVGPPIDTGPHDGGLDAYVATDSGVDAYVATDSGVDAYVAIDAGNDAYVATDAGNDAYVATDAGVDAFCSLPPPPCAAPPPGCHYEGAGCGTCGTIVCGTDTCTPACDATDYCDHCGSALTCMTRPTPTTGICPALILPVCGCDGVTYSNSCYLGHAGVGQWHAGACDAAAN